MSDVERWDCIIEDDEAIMVSGGGLFVLHSDYAALEAESRRLREALESVMIYADHLPTCGQRMNLPCDCDFHTERRKWEAALALAKEGK